MRWAGWWLIVAGCATDKGTGPGADASEADADVDADTDSDTDADTDADTDTDLEPCTVDEVPEEASLRPGWQEDGTFISPGGRLVVPAGPNLILPDMALDVEIHPSGSVAYVTLTARNDRTLVVVDLDSLAQIQEIDRDNAHHGLRVDAAGERLYAASGATGYVDVYSISDEDGALSLDERVSVGGTTTGLVLSPAGDSLWVGDATAGQISRIDTETLTVEETIALSNGVWDLVYVPGRDEIYASDLYGSEIAVIDVDAGEEVALIEAPTSPAGLAVRADGSQVFAAISNGDVVVQIDTSTRSVARSAAVGEEDLLDESGMPLLNSNITALWLDEARGRLYASRGADNAVSVLDASTLERLGAFPVAMYPTDLQLRGDDNELVVVEYKGGLLSTERGSMTLVDLDSIDLDVSSDEVSRLFASPAERFPFTCDGFFPVPTRPDRESPIEHVVLIVKENKTLDCLFGDMKDVKGLNIDEEYLRWPADATPNQRALIRQFNIADNFYVDTLESDSGHLFLTAAHLTHYTEWMWVETAYTGGAFTWPVADATYPTVGNFFSHLLNHDKTLQIYGEIVGLFAEAEDGTLPVRFSDVLYPGGPAVNYTVTDEEKALYIAEQIAEEGLASFTFISLPNDHTVGTSPGDPTPESMVADNDAAVGIVVDAVSHSDDWEESVVFILQDDPQGCDDHLDEARSLLIVASPWARHGAYVSHSNTNFLSVFATIERILDVPPLGRTDAVAVPLWDLFQPDADLTPYNAIPRKIPPETNKASALGADISAKMDFSGPDRSPELTPLLDAYGLMLLGRISREEAEQRLAAPRMALDEQEWEELEEESEEERFAFDSALRRYQQWVSTHSSKETDPPK